MRGEGEKREVRKNTRKGRGKEERVEEKSGGRRERTQVVHTSSFILLFTCASSVT